MPNKITIVHRPVIADASRRQRALPDKETNERAEEVLTEALKGEKPGAEGYILKVFKVEKQKDDIPV